MKEQHLTNNTTSSSIQYHPVHTAVHDNEEDCLNNERVLEEGMIDDNYSEIILSPNWPHLFQTPCFPDNKPYQLCGTTLLEGPCAVKFLKFLILSWTTLLGMHSLVRWLPLEHDTHLTISDLYHYESSLIFLDMMVFFTIGRLFEKQGVDHLAWIVVSNVGCLWTSVASTVPFLQHSVTLYELHCRWPWSLWVFAGVLTPLIISLVGLHVREAWQQGRLVQKLLEVLVTVLFTIVPAASSYFHLHHWMVGWLLGMHCNFDNWWSRLTMAWCWGLYLNGIAVYGRDPLRECDYAYFVSQDLQCPSLTITIQNDTTTAAPPQHMPPPADWRNCSARGYHP